MTNQRVVIVGASTAGISAAEGLRDGGFDGAVVLLGSEELAPYNRPTVSKECVSDGIQPQPLRAEKLIDELALDLRLGARAVRQVARSREVHLADGTVERYDGLVVATGARARRLRAYPVDQSRVLALRDVQDAAAVREMLVTSRHVTLVGGGFVSAEVATAARDLGCEVTILEAAAQPMERVFGPLIGSFFKDLYESYGISVRTGVQSWVRPSSGRQLEIECSDATVLRTDGVVVAVGAIPNTEWLDPSALSLGDGLKCDQYLAAAESIYAAGDMARWPHPIYGQIRVEHWTNAIEQGFIAGKNLGLELQGRSGERTVMAAVPYFWSEQCGVKVQLAGRPLVDDQVVFERRDRKLFGFFGREGVLTAILTWNAPREMALIRRRMVEPIPFDAAGGPLLSKSAGHAVDSTA